jgi:hypothetical protein
MDLLDSYGEKVKSTNHVSLLCRPPGQGGSHPVLEGQPEVALLRQDQSQLERTHLQT